jgi:peptidoglycan/xylan/chitin deacetylase (PgdA/CDA1 family)
MKESRFRTITANFVIIAVLTVTMGIAVAFSMPTDTDVTANAIYSGNTQGERVSLMFNVYENTDNVLEIAEILKENGVNATFFVGGVWAAKNGDALVKLASDGFEIGNHGYMHRDHAKLNYQQNIDEIKMTERTAASYLSLLPDYRYSRLFAPPSGSIGANMFKAADAMGYKVIMWTRDTIDWRDHDVKLIYSRAVKDIAAGDLILMHPTDCTVQALPQILAHIKNMGLTADCVSNTLS